MARHQQSSSLPTPGEILELAARMGYRQRREEASYTLFLEKDTTEQTSSSGSSSSTDASPTTVLINVFYTTRSLMTFLVHPIRGSNQLWRSNAYQNLRDLQAILQNPRMHTSKGYRTKNEARRGCAGCGLFKKRNEFSENQWRKGPDMNKCKECVLNSVNDLGAALDDIVAATDDIGRNEIHGQGVTDDPRDQGYPPLTMDALEQHDNLSNRRNSSSRSSNDGSRVRKERRQFNCPDCPRHGRGKFVFFKKVPMYKPIVKCPKCKRATQGRCQRLHAIPKHQEKGYGLFKCHKCRSRWGSSRAVANIGQECYTCKDNNATSSSTRPVYVKPFRLEVLKPKVGNNGGGSGILGGGGVGRGRTRRVPRVPLTEDEEVVPDYTTSDHVRYQSAASNALAGDGVSSFDFVARDDDAGQEDSVSSAVRPPPPSSSGYRHHCQGCATGVCRSRYLPKSITHDNSDGDTVSTSASVVTNSSVAKDEFQDRDADFDDFLDDDINEGSSSSSTWVYI